MFDGDVSAWQIMLIARYMLAKSEKQPTATGALFSISRGSSCHVVPHPQCLVVPDGLPGRLPSVLDMKF